MKVFSTNEIHIYGMEQLSFLDCYTKSSEVTRCAFLLVTRFYSLRFFTRFLLVAIFYSLHFLLVAFFYSLHFGLFCFVSRIFYTLQWFVRSI